MIKQLLLAAVASCAAEPLLLAQSRPVPITKPIEYYNPDWSPDGRTLVFESTLSGKYAIYTVRPDGSALKQLTGDNANSEQASWSPDGRSIAFSSDRAGHSELFLMNADGTNQRRLTTTAGGGYYGARFSPDGRWIAFQGRPDNREVADRVYVVAADGSGLRQLSDSSFGAEGPRWSADGGTITFRQVPYPKRLWSEMGPADLAAANKGAREVTLSRDGKVVTGAVPAAAATRAAIVKQFSDSASASGVRATPDGQQLAYTKQVDSWWGLYLYDIAARAERLVTGGKGAGPVGYLRTATLTAGTDTIDTFESPRTGGQIKRGNGAWVVRTVRQAAGRRWELADTWYDSAGKVTARQSVRTAPGSLATELEWVRAAGDSATLLVSRDRVTGWVVPAGGAPRLLDGPLTSERFGGTVVAMAIAKAKPGPGAVFLATNAALYGANPLDVRVDSVRVLRRDTLYRGSTPLPVLVLERAGGTQLWVDEVTGAEVLSRGSAGPTMWWWHIRRGVRPPELP